MLEMLSSEYFTRGSRFFREISKIATMRRMPVFGWKGALALEILLLLSSSTHLPFNIFFFFSLKNNTESSPLFEVENKNVAKHQQRSSLSFFSFLFFFFLRTSEVGSRKNYSVLLVSLAFHHFVGMARTVLRKARET